MEKYIISSSKASSTADVTGYIISNDLAGIVLFLVLDDDETILYSHKQ
jgi:hypothetical protein